MSLQHGQNVLFHSQLAENGSFLRKVADAILPRPQIHGHVGDVVLVDENSTRIGGDQAHNGVEGCGLAGAVRSKQANNFPCLTVTLTPFTTRRPR